MSRRIKNTRRKARNKNKNQWYAIGDDIDENRSDVKRVFDAFNEEDLKKVNKRLTREVAITPRTDNQRTYVKHLTDPNTYITFGIGPAGTGKTLLATQTAVKGMLDGKFTKIVITRPAVCADEELGFLPGALGSKMQPFIQPILDIFEEYYTAKEVQDMLKNKDICIEPLAFMRGRTFKDSFIIADEMQNSTPEQMKMLLTRIGDGSQIAVTGDLNQHDRKFERNGLLDFVKRLETSNTDMINVCYFNNRDIQRHKAIEMVLELYGEGINQLVLTT